MESEKIFEEFRKLIAESCVFEKTPLQNFQCFHHDYLKFFFGVMKIQIDYSQKTIELWSPKPICIGPVTTFNISSSVNGIVSYEDLEATLLGCVEETDFSCQFYKHMLYEYYYPNLTTGSAVKSA